MGGISSVANVPNASYVAFKAGAMDRVSTDLLNQPGAFSESPIAPAAPEAKPEKQGSVLGSLVKLVLKTAGLAAVAIAARKYMPALQKIQVGELAADAKPLEKAKHYFAKYTDLGYSKLEEGVDKVIGYFVKAKPEAAAKTGLNATA